MKTKSIATFITSMFILCFLTQAQAAELVKKEFSVKSFTDLELKGIGNIIFTQGDKESVVLETDTTIMSTVELESEDNKLTIFSTINFWSLPSNHTMNIYITVKHLKSVRFKDVGDIKSTNEIKTDSLVFFASAIGNATIKLKCKSLTLFHGGAGNFTASGQTTDLQLDAKGAGNVQLSNLIAENASITFKGVGNINVYASKKITIDAKGIGNVTYKGNPPVKNIVSKGLGSVSAE